MTQPARTTTIFGVATSDRFLRGDNRWEHVHWDDIIGKPGFEQEVSEVAGFVLAGTIEGLTNPGLSAGLKNPARVVGFGGQLIAVRLYFVSAPATSIEIDVLQNGQSIFNATKLQLGANQNGPILRTSGWRTEPLTLVAGDVLTVNVLGASPSAKDGFLAIVMR